MQKITLIGRLGRDAAIRETQDGGKFVSFTMAVTGRSRGVEKTSWYDVSTFNYDRYRNMVKYLTKGSSVIVVGELDADVEEGRDGVFRCRRNVSADSIEFGPSSGSGSTTNSEERTERTEARTSRKERRADDEPADISDEELNMTSKPSSKKAKEEPEEEDEPRTTRKATKKEETEPEEKKPVKKAKPAEADEPEEELPF